MNARPPAFWRFRLSEALLAVAVVAFFAGSLAVSEVAELMALLAMLVLPAYAARYALICLLRPQEPSPWMVLFLLLIGTIGFHVLTTVQSHPAPSWRWAFGYVSAVTCYLLIIEIRRRIASRRWPGC